MGSFSRWGKGFTEEQGSCGLLPFAFAQGVPGKQTHVHQLNYDYVYDCGLKADSEHESMPSPKRLP